MFVVVFTVRGGGAVLHGVQWPWTLRRAVRFPRRGAGGRNACRTKPPAHHFHPRGSRRTAGTTGAGVLEKRCTVRPGSYKWRASSCRLVVARGARRRSPFTELARGTPRGKAMRVLCLVAALLLVHAAFCQAESRTSIQLFEEIFIPSGGINIQTAQAYARERGKRLVSTKVSFDSRTKTGATTNAFIGIEAEAGGVPFAEDDKRSTESAFRALAAYDGPCEDGEKSAECLLEYKGSAGATLAHGGKQKLNVKLKGNVPAGTIAEGIEAGASSFDANRVPTTDNVWESLR